VLVQATNLNGVSTQWQFDGLGRVRTRLDGTGNATNTNYTRPDNSRGVIAAWGDSTGRSGLLASDQLGRETLRQGTAFDGTNVLVRTTTYEAASGKPGFVSRPFTTSPAGIAVTPPGDGWFLVHDEMGRLIAAQPNGNEINHTITYVGLKMTEIHRQHREGISRRGWRGSGRTQLEH
jgi:hypothetical protein